MAIFEKLQRVWSHGYMEYIPNFYKEFPELKDVDREELAERFYRLKVDFYKIERTKVKLWHRITLPIALVVYVLLLVGMPINFIIAGSWSYRFKTDGWLMNWFRALGLN